ncbi:MAG: hypothetical protein Q8N04_13470 [Nitrospira sp.]|nr:hypothetical protein [Nitrospira sp.]
MGVNGVAMIWLTFVCGAVVIVPAGTRLSRYGDEIAELTGFGAVMDRRRVGRRCHLAASLLFRIAKMVFQQPARISRLDTLL